MTWNVAKRTEEPEIQRGSNGKIESVSVVFGPHHFVDIRLVGGKVVCAIGATHHGVSFEAAEVMGPLEEAIDLLKATYPGRAF